MSVPDNSGTILDLFRSRKQNLYSTSTTNELKSIETNTFSGDTINYISRRSDVIFTFLYTGPSLFTH